MANTISPNMGLIVPGVGTEPGPTWATDLNSDLGILDQHNHSNGQGVQITTAGININTDLTINGNNLTHVKTVNFNSQVASLPGLSPNLGCVYVAGNELYYNDESGNVVQITNVGSVNAGAGSITGLPSGTASASYSSGSQTFIWQSATNTAANMDNGSVTIREVAAAAHGITISSPGSLAADYSITLLPTLPGSTSFLTIDNSGNLSTSSIAGLFPVSTANIADHAVTQIKLAPRTSGSTVGAGGVAISITFSTNITTNTPILGGVSITLTTTGRPVRVLLQSDPSGSTSNVSMTNGTGLIFLNNTGTLFSSYEIGIGTGTVFYPSSVIDTIDMTVNGAPGTYTYTLGGNPSSGTIGFINCLLMAYEI